MMKTLKLNLNIIKCLQNWGNVIHRWQFLWIYP